MADSPIDTKPVGKTADVPPTSASPADRPTARRQRREAVRWWIKLILQPLLLLLLAVGFVAALGLVQRLGWMDGGSHDGAPAVAGGDATTRYICPMMCTPPQSEPGRCPVCAMELVPVSTSGGPHDPTSVQIEPAARRVAHIQTATVAAEPLTRVVRAIGELHYDEGTLKTISAYVDGRIEQLYADYTGVVVKKGDRLALLYSPRLYSGQVELLLAKKARDESRSSTLRQVLQSSQEMYESTRQRLIELGMTEPQIAEVEASGEASSRLHLYAPSGGTVIEKKAVEGQYVSEGEAIYRLADLSTVWLMLRLFPEDAAIIRYGQKVQAEVQSLPGRIFEGRVAFVDPNVDPQTRTVGVRVVVPNPDGVLRVGDYAKATIEVPLSDSQLAYDPELANKWISPLHPQVIRDQPGRCPISGMELVPAEQLGFSDQPPEGSQALVVPRDAVLMAGDHSVVYVETEPGRFQLRRVELGPTVNDKIVIRSGVQAGEQVATRGNFLIDSQMQLAGNPSLIDPTRLEPTAAPPVDGKIEQALAALSPDDRKLVEQQQYCPVLDTRLGSMGVPVKVDVDGRPVFICCEGCRKRLLANSAEYLAELAARPEGGTIPAAVEENDEWELPPIDTMEMVPEREVEAAGQSNPPNAAAAVPEGTQ